MRSLPRSQRASRFASLQPDTAGFQQEHCRGVRPIRRIARREIQSSRHLGPRHLAHAAGLKSAFERDYHHGLCGDGSSQDDAAIIRLRRDALHRQPGRLQTFEWAEQFATCAGIQEALRPCPSVELDEAAPEDKMQG